METRSRKRQSTNSAAANTNKSNKRGRKSEAAEAVEPNKRACQQGRASKRDTKAGAAVSPRAATQATKESRQTATAGKDKKQEAQPAKMDSSSRRLRSENEDDMMDDDHVRLGGCALQVVACLRHGTTGVHMCGTFPQDEHMAALLGRSAGGTTR